MIAVRNLSKLFVLKNIVLFKGKLYEKITTFDMFHKYRVIINDDDYDYVTSGKLRTELDRAFKKLEIS